MKLRSANFPNEIDKVSITLEANRRSAFSGRREDQCWKEWWCLTELYNRTGFSAVLPRKFRAEWLDADGDPDFRLISDTEDFHAEVTEATCMTDRRAIAASRTAPGILAIGDPVTTDSGDVEGGRFQGGITGDKYERSMVSDIIEAIRRKRIKPYARGTLLIVYPNSNAGFATPQTVAEMLSNHEDLSQPFRAVSILISDGLILVNRNGVEYFETQVADQNKS